METLDQTATTLTASDDEAEDTGTGETGPETAPDGGEA